MNRKMRESQTSRMGAAETEAPVRTVLLPTSREARVRSVLRSFGFLHYVDEGDRLLLHDGERRMEVDVAARADVRDGHGTPEDDAGRECLSFSFIGYSEDEADELIRQYLAHNVLTWDDQPVSVARHETIWADLSSLHSPGTDDCQR